MARAGSAVNIVRMAHDACYGIVRRLTLLFAGAAGLGVVAMMVITCVDVLGRAFGRPLTGAVDLVRVAMVFVVAGALPYTTAVKGHVAVEYFFHKLSRRWRVIVDTFARLLGIGLFAVFCRQCIVRGLSLKRAGEVMPTLDIPMYWLLWVVAVSCGLVVLVILYNMLHPRREMIKP